MSSIEHYLKIESPRNTLSDSTFETEPTTCLYCAGRGFFWDEMEENKTTCPNCKGSKKVKAKITIHWMACKEKQST